MDSLYIYPGRGLDASCMCVARGLVQIKRHLHVRTQHLAMRRMRPALFQHAHVAATWEPGDEGLVSEYGSCVRVNMQHVYVKEYERRLAACEELAADFELHACSDPSDHTAARNASLMG
jgi:hypothetical protein